MDRDQIGWIDTARGLGILAVVAGHVFAGAEVHRALYLFHMPLFFLLSGMVFRPAPMRQFLARRGASLLVPYLAFLLLVTLIDIAVAPIEHRPTVLPLHALLGTAKRVLVGGEELRGIYGTFWFVTCLFLVQLVANRLYLWWGDPRGTCWALAMLACLALAYLIPYRVSPWDALVGPMGLVLFILGRLYRRHDLVVTRWPVTVAVAVFAVIGGALVQPMNMKFGDYGTPVATLLVALAICHLVFMLARALGDGTWPVRALASLGEASLVILFLHLTLFHDLKAYLPEPAVFAAAVLVPWVVHVALRHTATGRRFFLGGRGRR